jgi:hypothetical protein
MRCAMSTVFAFTIGLVLQLLLRAQGTRVASQRGIVGCESTKPCRKARYTVCEQAQKLNDRDSAV